MVMTTGLQDYSDVHYTRPDVAKAIVEHFRPHGTCYEPFKGDGAILKFLPKGAYWTEIEEGKDFFNFKQQVDWIITNPPYSNLTDVMKRCFELSVHTVFLVPQSKIYSSAPRMKLVRDVAGIREKLNFGSGRELGFNTGFPFSAFHFERGYKGSVVESWIGQPQSVSGEKVDFGTYAELITRWNQTVNDAGIRQSNGRKVPVSFWSTFLNIPGSTHRDLMSGTSKRQNFNPLLARIIELTDMLPTTAFLNAVRLKIPEYENGR